MSNYNRLTDPLMAIGSALVITFLVCWISTSESRPPNAWHALAGAVLTAMLLLPINFGPRLFETDFWSEPKAPGLLMVVLFMLITFVVGGVPAACVVSLYRKWKQPTVTMPGVTKPGKQPSPSVK